MRTMNERYLASRIRGMGTTIFAEMSALAARHQAVNLGQAFRQRSRPRRHQCRHEPVRPLDGAACLTPGACGTRSTFLQHAG